MELKDAIQQAHGEVNSCIARQTGMMKARYVVAKDRLLLCTESYGPLGGLSPLMPWAPDMDDFDATNWVTVPTDKIADAPWGVPAPTPERGACTVENAREAVCRAICDIADRGIDLESDGRCTSFLADALCKLAEAEVNLNTIHKEENPA